MAQFGVRRREAIDYIAVPVRTTMAELPADVGRAFGELGTYLEQRGAEVAGAGLIRYHRVAMDAPFTVEVGQAVTWTPQLREPYRADTLPAGLYAVAEQRGPYAWIGGLTQELMRWGEGLGLDFAVEPGGAGEADAWTCWFEEYLDEPVEGPQGLEGDVHVCVLLRE